MMKRIATAFYIMMCSYPAYGATQIFSEKFEGTTPLQTDFNAIQSGNCNPGAPGDNCHAACVTTAQPHGGTKSARIDATGVGGCEHHGLPNMRKFYLSYWMYLSSTFNPCVSPDGHLFRLYTHDPYPGGGSYHFDNVIECSGFSGDSVQVTPDVFFASTVTNTLWGALTLTRGQWTRIEIEFDQGTTPSNGSMMAWYTNSSGKHPWNYNGGNPLTGHQFIDGSGQHLLEYFALYTNLSNPGGVNYWYADDIEIWDGCPGTSGYCGVTGPDTTAPAAPTGLKVK